MQLWEVTDIMQVKAVEIQLSRHSFPSFYIIDDAKRDLVLIFKKNFYFFQHNKKEPENFNFKVLPTH